MTSKTKFDDKAVGVGPPLTELSFKYNFFSLHKNCSQFHFEFYATTENLQTREAHLLFRPLINPYGEIGSGYLDVYDGNRLLHPILRQT
jgi:hypothetical protein